jgi:Kef-type K+ transport system membrane component KefB
LIAILGKVLGGLTVPGKGLKRLTIGVGMIPRGEVGIIFATLGLTNKVIDSGLYAAIIFVVAITTFMTPPLLKWLLGRHRPKGGTQKETHPAPAIEAT